MEKNMPLDKNMTLLRICDVCKMVGISKTTLQRHRLAGRISPSYYVGVSPRFTMEDVEHYLTQFKQTNINFGFEN